MAQKLTNTQVRMLRLRAQHLAPPRPRSANGVRQAGEIVKELCGIQAQDESAAALAVRARCPGLVALDVEQALVEERSVVRTWLMRGTLHLVAAEDLGWILSFLASTFIRSNRGRRAELGLDDETGARGVRALRDLLAERGPLTRAEIREQLAARGLPTVGQATIHLIGLAALQGLLCYGPHQKGKETFVLLSDWIDQAPVTSPEWAPTELARRYLAAYSPATPEDYAAWSGLSLGKARAAWQQFSDQLLEVKFGETSAWMLQNQATWLEESFTGHPIVNLLPAYDTYLLGYRSRDLALPPKHAKRIYPGGGYFHPALLVDGCAAGTWKIKRYRDHIELILEPFEELSAATWQKVELETRDLGHFMGAEASVKHAGYTKSRGNDK